MNAYFVSLIAYFLISFLLLLTIVLLLRKLFRSILRNRLWAGEPFSGNPVPTLLGVGIAALAKMGYKRKAGQNGKMM